LLACQGRNAWSSAAAATAPEQPPLPAAPRRCLSPAALVRVQARDSCPAGGRATRASTSAWMVGRCQPVWTVTAGLEGMTWRSAGRRCLLAAQTVALSDCHRHPGDPVHPSNSVLLSATHPPSCSVSRCLSGVPKVETPAWSSAAAHRGSCFAPSSEQTGSRTRGRSSSHAPAALAARNLWSTHTLLDLFYPPVEAVVSWVR
jgi:hypothetical protein